MRQNNMHHNPHKKQGSNVRAITGWPTRHIARQPDFRGEKICHLTQKKNADSGIDYQEMKMEPQRSENPDTGLAAWPQFESPLVCRSR